MNFSDRGCKKKTVAAGNVKNMCCCGVVRVHADPALATQDAVAALAELDTGVARTDVVFLTAAWAVGTFEGQCRKPAVGQQQEGSKDPQALGETGKRRGHGGCLWNAAQLCSLLVAAESNSGVFFIEQPEAV